MDVKYYQSLINFLPDKNGNCGLIYSSISWLMGVLMLRYVFRYFVFFRHLLIRLGASNGAISSYDIPVQCDTGVGLASYLCRHRRCHL